MIPTITSYLYELHHHKGLIVAQLERKHAMHLAAAGALITILLVLLILLKS
jgi:hypothetical protein